MTSTTTKTRKPARKPQPRSATLGTLTNGKTLLWITKDGEQRGYLLTPIASDFGTAFHLVKADNGDGSREEYDVLLDGRETSCTCPGHTYGGKCKHVDAIQALVNAGKLQAAQRPQAAPAIEKPVEQAVPAIEQTASVEQKHCFGCGCPVPPRTFYCEECSYL